MNDGGHSFGNGSQFSVARRTVFRAAGTGFGLWLLGSLGDRAVAVEVGARPGSGLLEAIPGGSLDTARIPKFQTPLLVPPVMPRAGTIRSVGGKNVDYYEISVRQFSQQVLPAPFPATTVWGYGPVSATSKNALFLHNAPSLTIEAHVGRPVRVKWVNHLLDDRGDFLPHLLPVDPTLHWANPAGGVAGRDSRPTFSTVPAPYKGPVPLVTHLHGAVGVGDESDGYPEAWYLPAAKNLPSTYATHGTWFDYFAGKAWAKFGVTWGPGHATFEYPNTDRASTNWYHDHTLGMTRLTVYSGPAGFFILRGGPDDVVLDSRTGLKAVLPGPAPKEGDKLPAKKTYYEIALAIQDRSFNSDGSLFYPDSREFFDEATESLPGYIPDTDLSPIWNPEFFGNTIIVNGNTWPFHTVEQRRYRFRVLNGCQSRFLILDFSRIPGAEVWQLGNEGGFLPAPVNLTAHHGNRLLMALAERADLIVDFTNVPVGNHVLGNVGPDEPFGGGEPGVDFPTADPHSTGDVMQFRVVPAPVPDPSTPPSFLALPARTPLPPATVTRRVALMEMMSAAWDGPAEAMLGTVDGTGRATGRMWMDPVTENPAVGATEVWEIYNTTGDAHPMHLHDLKFEVVNRQPVVVRESTDGNGREVVTVAPTPEPPRPPEAWEAGMKDMVIAYPSEVTRLKAQFLHAGQYVWHCHIVEHEDNEMMRPFRVGEVQPGQPD